jgi:hypothetical protein
MPLGITISSNNVQFAYMNATNMAAVRTSDDSAATESLNKASSHLAKVKEGKVVPVLK